MKLKSILSFAVASVLMLGCVTPGMARAEKDSTSQFTDTASHWGASYIAEANRLGLMTGTGSNTFSPNGVCTRAQVAQTLYALAGRPQAYGSPFRDLTEDWYKKAVGWCYSHRVAVGTSEQTFGPNKKITREEIAVMLYAYADKSGLLDMSNAQPGALDARFSDGSTVSAWAEKAMSWAVSAGMLSGQKQGNAVLLAPKSVATRAELAVMLVKFQSYLTEQEETMSGTLYLDAGTAETKWKKLGNKETAALAALLCSETNSDGEYMEAVAVYRLNLNGTVYLFPTEDGTPEGKPVQRSFNYIAANGLGTYGSKQCASQEDIEAIYAILQGAF